MKRKKKYIDFFLDSESKSKRTTKNKSELQKIIIEQLKSRNQKGLKGKIAIEITAYSNQKNPPQIEKFVKNLVDIMHKKDLLLNEEEQCYLPFTDDNQIKYLRAKYVFLKREPRIHVKIRLFSSLISDINFVHDELNSKYCKEPSTRNYWEEYEELIRNKEKYLKSLSKEAYDRMVMLITLDVQKEICDAISIDPHLIGLVYPKRSKYMKKLGIEQTFREWASMLLKVPIRIHLPGIPLKEGEDENYKRKYKADITKLMQKYLDDHPIFKEIQSPILISTFYVPPKRGKNFRKDLDNIMLEYIMPAMNEIFYPPISLFNIGMEDTLSHENQILSFNIPKSLNGSAIGYEIIELPLLLFKQ